MFLERFKVSHLTLQLQYASAFELWDRAGAIARGMVQIWPDLELAEGLPQQQILRGKGIQVQTGVSVSSVILSSLNSIDPLTTERLTSAFKMWRSGLALERLTRLSTRVIYASKHDTIGEANAALRNLNLVRLPTGKMFDQSAESDQNTVELTYKFEDAKSFSFLGIRTEKLKYAMQVEPPFELKDSEKEINRLVLDFDRGLLGSIDASQIRLDDWLKGFQHILRRDIDKLVGS